MKRLILLIFMFTICQSAWSQCSALPTAYCGITNTNIYSGAAPTIGSAGTVTTDPDFGGKVIRVTQDQFCGDTAGGRYGPDDGNGWSRSWNADDTKLLVNNGGSNAWYYVVFDPVNFTVGSCTNVIPNKLAKFPNFAWQTTNRIYGLFDANHIGYWDTGAGSATSLFDMSTIPGFTKMTLYLVENDENDQWFCSANNGQDTGTQVGCWNQVTTNTQVIDLAAATEKQNSSAPVALDNLSSSQLANCQIHSISFDRSTSSMWLLIQVLGCTAFPTVGNATLGTMFWQIGTNHVTYIPSYTYISNHAALGFSGAYINNPGSQPPCGVYDSRGWKYWFVSNLGTSGSPNYVEMMSCLTVGNDVDSHASWLNNTNDANVNAYPVIVLPLNGAASNTGHYMEWEIDAIKTSDSLTAWNNSSFGSVVGTTVWRLAHTYNDAVAAQCPEMGYLSPVISRDGKFVAFPSDWGGQTGTGACTNSRRLDVFVVNAASATGPAPPTNVQAITVGVTLTPGASVR